MTVYRLLRGWAAVHDAGPWEAGGKAWNLARLARYGVPVPEGLVIPAPTSRQWLTDSGFTDRATRLDAADEHTCDQLQKALRSRPLPAELLAELQAELAAREWLTAPLAVRSSAPMEDSAKASFAGIHLSRLNVVGPNALEPAIREIWASLWTPAAIAYRDRMGMAHADAAMAVVIMPLLPAVASGIAFTRDPHSGRDDRLVIHAQWGFAETLVGGQAEGDEIVLTEEPEDDRLTLFSYRIGSKALTTGPSPGGGTHNIEPPLSQRTSAVLGEPETLELGELVRDAALALNFAEPAYDVEWVWDGDRFWLVQARPITTAGRNTYPALAAQPDIWSRGNTCEVLPEPLSAIDWCNSRRMVNALLEQGYKLAGYPLQPGVQRAGLFEGRLYLNAALLQWEAYDALGMEPSAMNKLMGGHPPEIAVPAAHWRDRLARLRRIVR